MNLQDCITKLSVAKVVPATVLAELPNVASKFGIDTTLKLTHFLSQCAHESGEFKTVQENLYYSDFNRIAQIFRHDVDLNHDRVIEANELENAKKYAKNPKALANFVYANQNGNGNEASGDGYNYHGRGFIQLTGRENYQKFSTFIGEDCVANPDLVATKYPLASAAFFFTSNHIWAICDHGSDIKTITEVTKIINGGTIGLPERTAEFNKFYNILK